MALRWVHLGSLTPSTFAQQAVIGAGAAGLITARELLKAGHRPVVLEQSSGLGGIWRSDSKSSPLYSHLRTNLPRVCAGGLRESAAGRG
jgi:cation diffusion facilitator CzcD-associated flavoprotein CzcO